MIAVSPVCAQRFVAFGCGGLLECHRDAGHAGEHTQLTERQHAEQVRLDAAFEKRLRDRELKAVAFWALVYDGWLDPETDAIQ